MVTVLDIKRTRGDTYPIQATIKRATNKPYDLSNVSEIKIGIAKTSTPASGEVLLVMDGSIDVAADGTVLFPVSDEDAAVVPAGCYFAQIRLIDASLKVSTKKFKFEVEGEIIPIA